MNRRLRTAGIASITAMALLGAPVAAIAAQPTSAPAAKKPAVGITAPQTVKVGEPVTLKTVFRAKTKDCFSPYIEWGDEEVKVVSSDGSFPSFGMCMTGSKKAKFKTQKDTEKHVYSEPGVYTIDVTAAAIPNGGGMLTTKGVKTKGKKKFSTQITVTGPNGELPPQASAGNASPSAAPASTQPRTSCDVPNGTVDVGCVWGQGAYHDGPNLKAGDSGVHAITTLTSSDPSVVQVGEKYNQGGYEGFWLNAVGSGSAELCATYDGVVGQLCSTFSVR